MPVTKAQMKAVAKYEKANYYKVLLRIPNSMKEKLQKRAAGSVNGYIIDLIKKDLGINDNE